MHEMIHHTIFAHSLCKANLEYYAVLLVPIVPIRGCVASRLGGGGGGFSVRLPKKRQGELLETLNDDRRFLIMASCH